MPRLSARELAFEYPGPIRAVDGLSLAVDGAELVCLIGPNGCGKSTLLRLCAGLLAPLSGRVELDGADVWGLTPRERARRVALVPQYLPALPEVRVEDFVLSGRYAHLARWNRVAAHDQELVREALESCDAAEFAQRGLGELSGGQRQRVLIARALVQQAPLVLIDEPTSALDPEHQIRVFELLELSRARGNTVVVATHDLNLAGQFATRLVLLRQGRVVADGDAAAVLSPRTLTPVYGEHLAFGERALAGGGTRPFVMPWRNA
ncbi:MAG: ABC transporter ATP-binding protein [Planctomycetes bacterium]|nr:ABC transporter ATP-binding protein [Planctomycetota bacterium]